MQEDGAVRISELSAQTAVPVATLKYYLREGVLQPGEARSATNAEYGAAHVDRVKLIRALVETAGLVDRGRQTSHHSTRRTIGHA